MGRRGKYREASSSRVGRSLWYGTSESLPKDFANLVEAIPDRENLTNAVTDNTKVYLPLDIEQLNSLCADINERNGVVMAYGDLNMAADLEAAKLAHLFIGRPEIVIRSGPPVEIDGLFEPLIAMSLLGASSISDHLDWIGKKISFFMDAGFAILVTDLVDGAKIKSLSNIDKDTFSAAMLAASAMAKCPVTANGSTYISSLLMDSAGINHGAVSLVYHGVIGPRATAVSTLHSISMRIANELRATLREGLLQRENRLMRDNQLFESRLGLLSHNAFRYMLEVESFQAARRKRRSVVVVFDIVSLNEINQQHGHKAGDGALSHVANLLLAHLRQCDVVGLIPGGKIGAILQLPRQESVAPLKRVLRELAKTPLLLPDKSELTIAVRVGQANIPWEADELDKVIQGAITAARSNESQVNFGSAEDGELDDDSAAASELEPGQILGGNYQILHEISRGGVGIVYRALDLALSRPVAIKLLRPEFAADEQFRTHLKHEASLLASVRHRSLTEVYSYSSDGESMYFVMELVEGEPLERTLARGKAKVQDTLKNLGEIAQALEALHKVGIVHLDIKPANVLLDPFRDRAVLIDVGIAKRLGGKGNVAGTPGFIAPEVMSGETTTSADVYGLAVTAYICLVRKLPWASFKTREKPIAPLQDEKPRPLPVALAAADAIFAKALAWDKQDRYPTPTSFVDALAEALADARDSSRSSEGLMQAQPTEWDADGTSEMLVTREVVLRAIVRVLGVKAFSAYRKLLVAKHQRLADIVNSRGDGSDWYPADSFVKMLVAVPESITDANQYSRDLGRSAVRASFQKFFPASAATLSASRTITSLERIWSKYHNWGNLRSALVDKNNAEIILQIPFIDASAVVAEWAAGFTEQVLFSSGVKHCSVSCTSVLRGTAHFRATWK